MTPDERDLRAARLSQAMLATGLSRRRIAAIIAAANESNAATVETNLKRWSAETPRDGAIDAAPDWVFDAVAELTVAKPETIAADLRRAAEGRYVPPALGLRAALVIEGLIGAKRKP